MRRRWYTALGLVGVCLIFTIGAASSEAVTVSSGRETPRAFAATATITQPEVVAAPQPSTPAPAFGSYAVIALESLIAAALLCYAFLQLRRVARAPRVARVVRLRGPPFPRVFSPTAS